MEARRERFAFFFFFKSSHRWDCHTDDGQPQADSSGRLSTRLPTLGRGFIVKRQAGDWKSPVVNATAVLTKPPTHGKPPPTVRCTTYVQSETLMMKTESDK